MSESDVIEKKKSSVKEEPKRPSIYVVILHNDPSTPRAFVVLALKQCFQKVEAEATQIMTLAHETGHAVVGSFSREIAEMKATKANEFSTKHGYILLFTAEKG